MSRVSYIAREVMSESRTELGGNNPGLGVSMQKHRERQE